MTVVRHYAAPVCQDKMVCLICSETIKETPFVYWHGPIEICVFRTCCGAKFDALVRDVLEVKHPSFWPRPNAPLAVREFVDEYVGLDHEATVLAAEVNEAWANWYSENQYRIDKRDKGEALFLSRDAASSGVDDWLAALGYASFREDGKVYWRGFRLNVPVSAD